MTFLIGFSGHINLSLEDSDWQKQILSEILREVFEEYGAFHCMVGNALGADSLCIEVLESLNVSYNILDTNTDYIGNGKLMAELVDCLIVMWDGAENYQPGGTADIVKMFRQKVQMNQKRHFYYQILVQRNNGHLPVVNYINQRNIIQYKKYIKELL